RRHLADLHGPAPQAAEHLQGVVGDLLVTALEQVVGALRGARHVGGEAAEEADRAGGEGRGGLGCPPRLAGGNGLGVARHEPSLDPDPAADPENPRPPAPGGPPTGRRTGGPTPAGPGGLTHDRGPVPRVVARATAFAKLRYVS